MNESRYKWIAFLFLSAIYGALQNKIILYVGFFLFFLSLAGRLLKREDSTKIDEAFIDILIISTIIPDNYIVILLSLLSFSFTIKPHDEKDHMIAAIIILAIWNAIVNLVYPINLLFYLIYTLPFFIIYVYFKRFDLNRNIYNYIIFDLYFIIASQLISITTYAITHLSVVRAANDLDWVTGTFGVYQGSVLMFVSICCSTILLFDFSNQKNKNSLLFSIIALFVALSTTSVTYSLILFISVIGCSILSSKLKTSNKIALISLVAIGMIVFIFASPDWIINEIPKLFDHDYFTKRIKKMNAYNDVFISLPNEFGALRSIFGCGAGQYSSRAALTCTGTYIDSYKSLFPVSMSQYTERFILYSNNVDEGMSSNSMSQIISIQGEFGYIGLLVMFTFFGSIIRKSKSYFSLMIVWFFIGLLFVDNVLEFAKYGVFFWLCFKMCNSSSMKHLNSMIEYPEKTKFERKV